MFQYSKPNKYRNKSCTCLSNHLHDSRGEGAYCDRLRYEKLGGEIKDYEIQKKFNLTVEGEHLCNHIVDFLVTKNDGTVEVHEYKGGILTREWRLKHKLFLKCYPNMPYKVVTKKDV